MAAGSWMRTDKATHTKERSASSSIWLGWGEANERYTRNHLDTCKPCSRHTCSVLSVSSVVIEPRERVLKFTAEEPQTG